MDEITRYPEDRLTFDPADPHEVALRSPIHWMTGIRTPTFIFEGTEKSNHASLHLLSQAPHADCVEFHSVRRANHFSLVEPLSWLIAQKILMDRGEVSTISFNDEEIAQAIGVGIGGPLGV